MRNLSPKQALILQYLRNVHSATLSEIIEGTGIGYYNNTKKYVGEILSRLVRQNRIRREKRGIYTISPYPNSAGIQNSLFP